MSLRYSPALLGALAISMMSSVGCLATHKHVREAIAPVQDQLNQTQGHVNTLQKQTDDNKQAIGDLDRQVATADEKASEAGKRAAEAAEAAAKANAAAAEAAQRASAANSAAMDAQQGVSRTNQNLQNVVQNLDNYKLVSTQPVHFGFAKSVLSKDEQSSLDDAIQKISGMKNYIIEVEGFADKTGNPVYNRELSRKRADAVVHYLAVEHNIPLRAIREIGAGSDFPDADNKTSAARKENRRVDVKIYALDLNSAVQQATAKSALE
jgi:outer membrane protein OmpA-like peptidoglycan-associated protein